MDNVVYKAKRYLLNDPTIKIKDEIEERVQANPLMRADFMPRIIEHILYNSVEKKEIKDYQIFAEVNEIIVSVIELNNTETEIIKIPIKE